MFKRKDGRWQENVYIPGEKRYRAVTAKSQQALCGKLTDLKYEIKHDIYVNPSNATLCDIIKESMEFNKISEEWEETTYQLYIYYLNKVFKPYFNKILIQQVRPYHIERFYEYRKTKKGNSANTCQKYHAVLSKAFYYAFKNNFIKTNPMDKVDRPKIKKKFKPEVCTEEKFSLLIDKVGNNITFKLVILIAATLGLRRSEIFALKWSDIDFENRTVNVEKAMVLAADKKYYDKDTKNMVTSIMKTPKFLIDELLKYRQTKKLIAMNGNSLIFDSLKATSCTHKFIKLRDELGLKLRFHDMRHFTAVIMLKNGVCDKEIADWLRHKQVSTTKEIYEHVLDEMRNKNSDIIGNAIQRTIK